MRLSDMMPGAAISIFAATILWAGPIAAKEISVAGLRTAGWSVVSKEESRRSLPGVTPYENLTRVIQVTTFVLKKGADQTVCEMAYDSQRDRIDETCTSKTNLQ